MYGCMWPQRLQPWGWWESLKIGTIQRMSNGQLGETIVANGLPMQMYSKESTKEKPTTTLL